MKTVKEYLQCVRAKLEKGWIQGTYARTATNQETSPRSPLATQFCLLGAVEACVMTDGHANYKATCEALRAELKYEIGIVWFNDQPGRTKEEVLALVDKAIQDTRI